MNAVILLSGGLDSTTCMAVAKSQGYDLYPISFNYHQRNKIELESAKQIAEFFGAKRHLIIDTNMNAINTEGNAIPGLYVIGNDSGAYFANTYPNLSTGMACGRTVTFGRHVCKYLAKL